MKQKFDFLNNNLFTTYTLENDFLKLYDFKSDLSKEFNSIKTIFTPEIFQNQNELQLENDFITKTLDILGFSHVRQDEKIIQGKLDKPDFLLFCTQEDKTSYLNTPRDLRKSTNEHISVILESKAYNVELDNKKVKDNPHFQLLRYLNSLKINFGFLTNGRFWRFYDNSTLSSQKIFYEVDLQMILESDDLEAFNYFYYIFRAQNFQTKKIEEVIAQNNRAKITIEDDLKSIIYGTDGKESIFEKIGKEIHAKHEDINLDEVYENSLYFIFRLLFIAYFEDKFDKTLETHNYFNDEISIHTLLNSLDKNQDKYNGIKKLNDIFKIYDKGEPSYDMPVFNGGLFDESKTKALTTPKLFSNALLHEILTTLLYFENGASLFKRDYKTLSVAHLGTIYEGLLSYFFNIAQEEIYYIEYKQKGQAKHIEGYFDNYDYSLIDKKTIIKSQHYNKGEVYLKNSSNSRKVTASYYTPQSITSFLVSIGLENKLNNENILNFKILDNACGSGHFLTEALNQVTQIVLKDFDSFETLQALHARELEEIKSNIVNFTSDFQIDEADVIKRLLLKRMIYGVDLNPFSVELTKLSLWIDSFIFGTPLSFIEHHIKCGNALVGSTIKTFNDAFDNKDSGLFNVNFKNNFNELKTVFEKLDSIKDTTEDDIRTSKHIYSTCKQTMKELNLYLHVVTVEEFLTPSEKYNFKALKNAGIESIVNDGEFRKVVEKYTKKFHFFNYEIEFPECVKDGKFLGFDIIVGNPPWDKTKFSDDGFFPQFKSDYRTLINSKKEELKADLLTKPHVKAMHKEQKELINATNEYYLANFPLSRGAGDGNLFRFFVEQNLTLLAKDGSLNYVLPSALMFEDGSKSLREEIFTNKSLTLFYSFENREKIFPDVDSRFKFALMQIQNSKDDNLVKTMFYKTNTDSICNEDEIIRLELELIKKLSPEQLSLMELNNKTDVGILKKCYGAFAPLNFSWLDFRRELDMTNDKDIFLEEFKDGLFPLYEGKMIHQFDATFSAPTYHLVKDEFDSRLKSKEISRMKKDLNLPKKAFDRLTNINEAVKYDREFFRIAYRGIASDTNERTSIFSLLSKDVGCGHSLMVSVPKRYILKDGEVSHVEVPNIKLLFALALFNSITIDFIARQMVQINFSKTYLGRIPLPQPTAKEIEDDESYKTLALNALKLQLYKNFEEFKELADEFDITKDDLPKTIKQYNLLRASNDIAIANLYGILKDEFTHMLNSFKVLNNKQPHFVELLRGFNC